VVGVVEYDGAGRELGWEEVWGEGGACSGYDGGQLVESVGEFVMWWTDLVGERDEGRERGMEGWMDGWMEFAWCSGGVWRCYGTPTESRVATCDAGPLSFTKSFALLLLKRLEKSREY